MSTARLARQEARIAELCRRIADTQDKIDAREDDRFFFEPDFSDARRELETALVHYHLDLINADD